MKSKDKKETKTARMGFLPDFSLYLEKHFPIKKRIYKSVIY